jgi:hypothetical protein
VSSPSTPEDRLTLLFHTLRNVPAGIPIVFALAAFLSAYTGSAYSAGESNAYLQRGQGIYCVRNCQGVNETWSQHNPEATSSANRGPLFLVFSFPVAMTLATVLAMSLGWWPRINVSRLLSGLALLYGGSVATALLGILSLILGVTRWWPSALLGLLLGLLAVAVNLYAMVMARAAMTGRDASAGREGRLVFSAFFVSAALGSIIGAVLYPLLPIFIFPNGMDMVLGAAFGASLVLPQVSPRLLPAPVQLSPAVRGIVERLVLALGAQVAVSAITLFQPVSRSILPVQDGPSLLTPFILAQVPFIILICVLLKQPGRQAFTFLTATLAFGILQTFFDPVVLLSYRQIYLDHPIGLMWPALSAVIYILTGILAYMVIQKTKLRPKPWSAILGTAGMFCYFLLIKGVTPHLYSLEK